MDWRYLIVAAVFALGACGGGNEAREQEIEREAARHGVDADVELNERGEVETVEIKGLGGTSVGSNLDLPADFPADVPVPADWSIMATTPAPGGYMVQALSGDDAQSIVDVMRASLSANGWAETSADTPTPQMRRIGFNKDDRMTNVIVTENGETHAVQIITIKTPG
ncbi:MAG: hypothetical protein AAFW68_07595 [Pseudomonadota bacterium]